MSCRCDGQRRYVATLRGARSQREHGSRHRGHNTPGERIRVRINSVRIARKLHAPYWLGRRLVLRRLARRAARVSDHVLVYQMGKVGSSTLTRALKSSCDDLMVHQVHTLTDSGTARLESIFRRSWPDGNPRHLWVSEFIRQQLDARSSHRPWKVITLVRDPIARNISSFFEIAQLEFDCDLSSLIDTGDEEYVSAQVRHLFLNLFDQHDRPLEWFNRELRPIFGFDVFSRPFPHRTGWARYEEPEVDLLVLRLEDLDRMVAPALKTFLGLSELRLTAANTTSSKRSAPVYGAFLRYARLPEWYIDHMYSSDYAQHFYTDAERDAFAARWRHPTN